MKRSLAIALPLLAAALASGGPAPGPVARAAAAEPPRTSLSGVLDVPAGESRPLPVKDPFRAPIEQHAAEPTGGARAPELPPLQLTAVLQGPDRVAAVVNGTILRPGDAYLDMTVLEIANNRVIFQRGEGKVTLFMQEKLYNPLSPGGK